MSCFKHSPTKDTETVFFKQYLPLINRLINRKIFPKSFQL